MKVLVCGGRNYGVSRYGTSKESTRARAEQDALNLYLDEMHAKTRFTLLIHGDAEGADTLAGLWARSNGVQEVACPANWAVHGNKAGTIRNLAMLSLAPDVVIAFPGGRGTAHMVRIAKDAGICTYEVT